MMDDTEGESVIIGDEEPPAMFMMTEQAPLRNQELLKQRSL
jgi:hypothetical protein